MLLSVRQYVVLFGVIIIFIVSTFALYINNGLDETHKKIELSQKESAVFDLESAIYVALKNVRESSKGIAEWQEVKQQLNNPEIFAYWYNVRFKKTVFDLQKYTLDLMIYDLNGEALAKLDDNNLPYKINVAEVESFIFKIANENEIIYIAPIYESTKTKTIVGYLSSRLEFMPILKSLGVFRYIQIDSIKFIVPKNNQFSSDLYPKDFIYKISKGEEVFILEKQMRSSIVELILVIGIPAILLIIALAVLVGIPINEINQYINRLRSNPEAVNDEVYRNRLKVKELKNIYDSLRQYHIELVQNEENISLTLNSIGDAVIATDVGGLVTRMNPVAEYLTGWRFEEVQGRLIEEIFPIIDAVTREEIENPLNKVLSSGKTVCLSNHTTLLSKNGCEYQIEDSAAPIRDGRKNIIGMVLVFNDVTERYKLREERLESEERFRQLAENINEVFWLGSPEWDEIYYVSPAYEKSWGLNANDLYSNPLLWMSSIHPDDRDQFSKDIPNSAHDIEEFIDFEEYRIVKPDGEIIWIKAKAYPIRDESGEVVRIAGIAEDITEQVVMEDALRRTQKMDALGKLTGGIAHDFNNMLGIILGYSELLRSKLSNDQGLIKYIDQIHDAGQRGASLTRKLLAFSKHKTSDAEFLNMNELLQDKKHMIEKVLTARIDLIFDLQDDLGFVWLDAGELENALINLSINSMHAIDGSGQLTIQTKNTLVNDMDAKKLHLNPGEYVLLSVADSGCGMDETTKEKIFEPFFTTKGDKGTGLGLSQVYGFVDRSDGAAKVYSELGHGTRFMFYFPMYNKAVSNEKSKNYSLIKDYSGSESILVVDDELSLLELANEILESNGYTVFTAQSAEEAMQILGSESIDLLLSDVIMPGQDGYQLSMLVREKYPDIKIQLASGFSEDRHVVMGDDDLRVNLLHKPYKAIELFQRIRELLG